MQYPSQICCQELSMRCRTRPGNALNQTKMLNPFGGAPNEEQASTRHIWLCAVQVTVVTSEIYQKTTIKNYSKLLHHHLFYASGCIYNVISLHSVDSHIIRESPQKNIRTDFPKETLENIKVISDFPVALMTRKRSLWIKKGKRTWPLPAKPFIMRQKVHPNPLECPFICRRRFSMMPKAISGW